MFQNPLCLLPIILSLLFLQGCIDAPPSSLEQDEDQMGAGLTVDSMGGSPILMGGDAVSQSDNAGNSGMIIEDGGESVAGEDQVVAGVSMIADPPPPPEGLNACDRFCQRAQDCLYSSCEDIQQLPPRQFCEGWCNRDNQEWLNQSADLACEDFNRRIFGFSPEVRALCEPLEEDRCTQICDFGAVCGLVSTECLTNCEAADLRAQLCFSGAATTGDCRRFIECFQGGDGGGGGRPNDRPDLNQVCDQLCNREVQCILEGCAAGSIDGSYGEACRTRCLDAPDPRALQERSQLSCTELVEEMRTSDPTLDARCDLDPESACATLCESVITPCGERDSDACLTECTTWEEARFVCLSRANQCEDVNTCLLPAEEAARCGRLCTHLEDCLLEACPPRIIPPQLINSCSADCFNDPVSIENLDQWEASTCRDVREFVYRDNPQLRPVCEGNQDFRPSPEECSAFCEQSLNACLIGGDALCLSACASLTRPQYECALIAQDDCSLIDQCLTEE